MSSIKNPCITPKTDGPLLVQNINSFASQKGSIETKETMALCRCGASGNKPFCDGTHTKIGFSSSRQEGRLEDKRDSYVGKKITIHDNRSICAHAGVCTDRLSNVFRLRQEPWIDPDAASEEEIKATVQACPSGALGCTIDDVEIGHQSGNPAIFIAPNGPYVVSGGPELVDTGYAEGASRNQFTLCRCGGSKNKPFCDGAHWNIKFTDDRN